MGAKLLAAGSKCRPAYEQDVLRLEVTVDHVVLVQEDQRFRNLADPPSHLRLVKLLLFLQLRHTQERRRRKRRGIASGLRSTWRGGGEAPA